MKKKIFPPFQYLMLVMLLSVSVQAQNPTYLCELRNDVQVSNTEFEFDIYLVRTGSVDFEYGSGQFGFLLNPAIKNGGIITASFVPGTSDPGLVSHNQTPNTILFTDAQNCIRISGRTPPGAGNGLIISNVIPGIRVVRVKLTNSVAFGQAQPNLTWTTLAIYPTQVSAYVAGTNTLIQDPAFHTTDKLANLILNPTPTAFSVTGGGSYCQGDAGLPVGLSDSENGVTYTLYNGVTPQVPTLSGNGSPLNFGIQLAGTYTITGSNGGGTTTMTGSAVISENSLPSAPGVGSITQPTCTVATGDVILNGLPASGIWTLTRTPGGTITNGSGSSITITGLTPNTYTYTVTNASSCISGASANIVINSQPLTPTPPVVGTITHPTCAVSTGSVVLSGLPSSGTWTLTRTPGGTTSGTGTSITISGLATGSYSYTVSNAAGCTSTASGTVVINAQPSTPTPPVVGTITHPTCLLSTGSVVLNGLPSSGSWTLTRSPGGTTTTGSGSSTTISGLAANTYTFTVTNSDNCTSAASANVVINSVPGSPTPPSVGTITQPTCAITTGDVVLNGLPATGTWTLTRSPGSIITSGTGSSTTISGLPPNTYTYTVTNAVGCTSGVSANVVINTQPLTPTPPVVGTITHPTCAVSTGSVVLSGLPASGTWTLTRTPGGTTTGTGTSTTISGLATGSYSYTVSNASGCTSTASGAVVINAQPSTPTPPVVGTITHPTCLLSTGSVVLSGLPSSGSWTLTRTPGGTTTTGSGSSTTISGLAANTYTFTVTNADACISVASANVLINVAPGSPTPPTAGIITQPTCSIATGSIVLNGLPATGTWTLTRSPGGTTTSGTGISTTVSGLTANSYSFTVTNAAGCTSASSANMVINAQPTTPTPPIVGTITHPTCSVATGSVVLSGLPSTGTWTLTRTPGGTTTGTGTSTTVTGLAANTYTFTVTNASSCISTASANVIINAAPATPTAPVAGTITQPTCALSTGSVVLNGLPASGTWTLTRTPGAITTNGTGTSTTITVLTAGTYTYTVTNSTGCISPASSNIVINSQPVPPSAPTANVSVQPTCTVPTGTIVVTGPIGAAYEYNIDGGVYQASTTFTGILPGNHILTARLAASTTCISGPSGTVTVNVQPPTPVINNQTTSILTGATFIVTPVGAGVPAGTTYTWSAPTYTNGVTGGTAQAVPQSSISGTLSIPTGTGSAVYTVTPTATPCVGGQFILTVTVTSTCVGVSIGTQPVNTTMCTTSGSASFTVVANGTSPFVYQWQYFNGSTWGTVANGTPAGAVYSNTATATIGVSGITAAGNYQYRCHITNCNGGTNATTAAATLTVNAPPVPTLTSSDADNVFCAGTSITFTSGGGTNYNFRVGGISVQNSASPVFTSSTLLNGQAVSVIVTNASGCSATSGNITNVVNAIPSINQTTPSTCAPDLATYSLAVTVSSGTVTSTAGTVTHPSGSVWSIAGILSGTDITVTVAAANGCVNILQVSAPGCICPSVLAPVSGGNRSYCASGIIPPLTATVLAGETIDWYSTSSGGTPLLSNSLSYTPTAAGTYYAGAKNITTNCTSTTRTPVVLTMNALPVPTLTSSDPDNTFCAGTSVTFTASGGTSYDFRAGAASVQNGASATYTTSSLTNGQIVSVIVSNAAGCTATSTGITNIVNTLPTANAGSGGNECDLTFTLNAVPSIGTGTWTLTTGPGTASFAPNANSPTATVTVSEYGTYTFTWTEVIGTCSRSSVITVNFYLQPVVNAGAGGNNCGLEFYLNGSLNIGTGTWSKVSGPGNVTFTPDANVVNPMVAVTSYGSYTFRFTGVNGTCSNNSTVTVNFILQAPANAGSGGNECDLDFIMKAVATIGTGTWSKVSGPGNAIFTPDSNQTNATVTVDQVGTYDFAWTVVNSTCTSSDIVRVVFHELPIINAGADTAICKNGNIQLHAQGTGSFSWVPAASVSNPDIPAPVAAPDTTTTYLVTLTDLFGCKNTDNIKVEVRVNPVANAGPDQILEYMLETQLDAVVSHSYEKGIWSQIAGTGEIFDTTYAKSSVSGLSLDMNTFLWTVTNGVCPTSSDSVNITVNNFIIPTLITPNLDGLNDYFILSGLTTFGRTELLIFDRRGARVYRNPDYDNSWDGVDYNNNPLPDDTYFYVIKTENGKSLSGYIVIRR